MRTKAINLKLTTSEYDLIKERAKLLGFDSVSEYMRYVCLNTTEIKRSIKK